MFKIKQNCIWCVLVCLSFSSWAQTRMIGHISKESGGFIPGLIIANTNYSENGTVTFTPYAQDGTVMEAVSVSLNAGVTEFKSMENVFNTSDVSHFMIEGDTFIEVSITYQSTQVQSSPVHVHESSVQSGGWRLYAGNWDVVWDGLALVNTGTMATDIHLIQRSANGALIASYDGLSGVAPNEKKLYVLSTDFSAVAGSYFEIVSNQPLSVVSLRGTYNWSEYQYLWENAAVKFAVDFHTSIANYKGAETCLSCHAGMDTEVMNTVHYKFSSALAQDYIYDEEGNPVERTYTGKFLKLCGFPTALPFDNWVGKLKDDPATPYIDTPGGCGTCHIGIGMAPAFMNGLTEPAEAEKGLNVDCLICHAADYQRNYYVATSGGAPELNASGAPIAFIAPRTDGVFDFSVYNEAARSVKGTTAETCKRCHGKSGGGGMTIEGNLHSFKRGDSYAASVDVHAAAGLDCTDCHYQGNHQMKRARNNDLSAYDNMLSESMCITCHSESPHENIMYNTHVAHVACTTCHATSKGGVTFKDFSVVTCPSGDCSPESLNTYGVQLTKFPEDFAITYAWFDGTVKAPIDPRGTEETGKLYPFKRGSFNQPRDINENPIPLKWGKLYVQGDMDGAISSGRSLYESYFNSFAGDTAAYGLPEVPGDFDHFGEAVDLFSLSHSITKTSALTCADCHSTENSVLDWEALGIPNPYPSKK